MKEMFSPQRANFNVCRLPIGANDYAETGTARRKPGDFSLAQFSIERDRAA
jgi:glucosylceramidase